MLREEGLYEAGLKPLAALLDGHEVGLGEGAAAVVVVVPATIISHQIWINKMVPKVNKFIAQQMMFPGQGKYVLGLILNPVVWSAY